MSQQRPPPNTRPQMGRFQRPRPPPGGVYSPLQNEINVLQQTMAALLTQLNNSSMGQMGAPARRHIELRLAECRKRLAQATQQHVLQPQPNYRPRVMPFGGPRQMRETQERPRPKKKKSKGLKFFNSDGSEAVISAPPKQEKKPEPKAVPVQPTVVNGPVVSKPRSEVGVPSTPPLRAPQGMMYPPQYVYQQHPNRVYVQQPPRQFYASGPMVQIRPRTGSGPIVPTGMPMHTVTAGQRAPAGMPGMRVVPQQQPRTAVRRVEGAVGQQQRLVQPNGQPTVPGVTTAPSVTTGPQVTAAPTSAGGAPPATTTTPTAPAANTTTASVPPPTQAVVVPKATTPTPTGPPAVSHSPAPTDSTPAEGTAPSFETSVPSRSPTPSTPPVRTTASPAPATATTEQPVVSEAPEKDVPPAATEPSAVAKASEEVKEAAPEPAQDDAPVAAEQKQAVQTKQSRKTGVQPLKPEHPSLSTYDVYLDPEEADEGTPEIPKKDGKYVYPLSFLLKFQDVMVRFPKGMSTRELTSVWLSMQDREAVKAAKVGGGRGGRGGGVYSGLRRSDKVRAGVGTAGGWTARRGNESRPEVFRKKIKKTLNKMTPDQRQKLTRDLVDVLKEYSSMDEMMTILAEEMHTKCQLEGNYAEMYAELVYELCQHPSLMPKVLEEENAFFRADNPNKRMTISRRSKLRSELLGRVELRYSEDSEKFKSGIKAPTGGGDELEAYLKWRDRCFNNVQFIGWLYNMGLLKRKVVLECLETTLCLKDEYGILAACKLMITVAYQMRDDKKVVRKDVENMFRVAHDRSDISKRVQFKIRDVLKVFNNGWMPLSGVAPGSGHRGGKSQDVRGFRQARGRDRRNNQRRGVQADRYSGVSNSNSGRNNNKNNNNNSGRRGRNNNNNNNNNNNRGNDKSKGRGGDGEWQSQRSRSQKSAPAPVREQKQRTPSPTPTPTPVLEKKESVVNPELRAQSVRKEFEAEREQKLDAAKEHVYLELNDIPLSSRSSLFDHMLRELCLLKDEKRRIMLLMTVARDDLFPKEQRIAGVAELLVSYSMVTEDAPIVGTCLPQLLAVLMAPTFDGKPFLQLSEVTNGLDICKNATTDEEKEMAQASVSAAAVGLAEGFAGNKNVRALIEKHPSILDDFKAAKLQNFVDMEFDGDMFNEAYAKATK